MNDLKLNIDRDDELVLPVDILTLPLEEIGAIATWIAIQQGKLEMTNGLLGTESMALALRSLKEKGIVKFSLKGKQLKIELDLGAIDP